MFKKNKRCERVFGHADKYTGNVKGMEAGGHTEHFQVNTNRHKSTMTEELMVDILVEIKQPVCKNFSPTTQLRDLSSLTRIKPMYLAMKAQSLTTGLLGNLCMNFLKKSKPLWRTNATFIKQKELQKCT